MRPGFKLVRHPSDRERYEGWLLGFQLAKNGVLHPMFDLHASQLADCRTAEEYEDKLCEMSEQIFQVMGPAVSTRVPKASSPSAR